MNSGRCPTIQPSEVTTLPSPINHEPITTNAPPVFNTSDRFDLNIVTQTQPPHTFDAHHTNAPAAAPLPPRPLKRPRTLKHKTPATKQQRQNQRLIRQRILPAFHAILSDYHNEQTFQSYLADHEVDATVDTWLSHTSESSDEGNSSDPTASMLAELETILHSFPQISSDDILQQITSMNPLSFLALDNANDTLTRSQMLRAPDKQAFLDAEEVEIQGLFDMNVWKYRRISTLPSTAHLINSVWSYHQKRTADGHLLKYKACLCANGRQQQYGVNFFDSYAPVITWTTVRLVLLLSVLCNLHCRQVDFTQAFPQADIDVPIFL